MLKIVTIVGARPQFIKAATISRVIRSRSDIEEIIVHTGQHFDENMSEIFFTDMDIPRPIYNLHIESLPHGAMTGRMLEGIEKILVKENPDWVLVYGDTNSTLAGALAASKLHIKLAHVEAGLRSKNMKMPEEQNRILTDRLSTILFCPSDVAVKNLEKEGFNDLPVKVLNVGDVMFDAVQYHRQRTQKPSWFDDIAISNGYALGTVHRAENTDDPERLKNIVLALNKIHESVPVVLPLHPRTRKILLNSGLEADFHIVEPVGYLEMLFLLQGCKFVLTDSGGLQKEAYFLKKRCVILRDETEWTELVSHGTNKLVGADLEAILTAADSVSNKVDFTEDFYGNGASAESVVSSLASFVNRLT